MTDDTASQAPDPAAEQGDAVPISLVPARQLDRVLNALPDAHAAWARLQGFTGKLGQTVLLPAPDGSLERVLFGWGDGATRARERFHLGDFARRAPEGTYRLDTDLEPDQAAEAVLGWLLGRYHFEKYKSGGPEAPADLLAPDAVDPERLVRVTEGVFLTRDLINTPANDMGPVALAGTATKLAQRHGARIAVTEGEALLSANLPLIHTVGRAAVAARAPRLIDIRWGDAGPALTLVGKGVCFDTGGLNLKPGSSMGLMKKDMGGAAAVLGLAQTIMALSLPLRLRVLIPAVENAVSGAAFRPGDILRSRKGLSVEINNTDAEGRLVLADALALADETPPDLLVSMATLTGAARVAVGPDIAPFFAHDDAVARALAGTAPAACDPVWRLPLHAPYESMIEPGIADLDNAPGGGFAGAITAALFLNRFVTATPRYAHFDIYGWQPNPAPARPKGGVGQGMRAILHALPRLLDLPGA